MKKLIFIIAIFLMLSLSACASQGSQVDTNPPSALSSEGITVLAEGVWPTNEYTEGLPVPPGRVAWAMQDTEHGNCSVGIVDISETEYDDYLALLKQAGFSVIQEISEKIAGQDYVSIGALLSNGKKGLSISYIPDNFTIYISWEA